MALETVLEVEYWVGHAFSMDNDSDYWWPANFGWGQGMLVVPRPTHHGEHPISGWPLEGYTRSEWWREVRRAFVGDVASVQRLLSGDAGPHKVGVGRKITDTLSVMDCLTVANGGKLDS